VLQLHENTTKEEAEAVMMHLYKEYLSLFTKNNGIHFSLSFRRGASRQEMQPLVNSFLEKLVEASGIHPSRLGMVGLLMTKPDSHAHIFCVSDKDRRTKKSIVNMRMHAVQALFDWWQGTAGSTANSHKIYDPSGLLDYQSSWKNASHPGQEWAVLPVHGRPFFDRLRKRSVKRKAA
jgi:hypothetical protein